MQNPALVAQGVNWNGHLSDPRYFFKSGADYLNAVPDTIQIVGASCAAGSPTLPPGQAVIAATNATTITLDRPCTWSANAGVSLPWTGTAPDMGAFEFGSGGLAAPDAALRPAGSLSALAALSFPRPRRGP